MAKIQFTIPVSAIGSWLIVKVPKSESVKLPSRGIVMVSGTVNGSPLKLPLEPDGNGSHWFCIDSDLVKREKLKAGDSVTVQIESTDEWIEPEVPADVQQALTAHPQAQNVWGKTTPGARWDWIRWIRATNNPDTRAHRIEVTISKLNKGMRRPCCFNRNMCTEPAVSKNWKLIESA